MKHPKVTIGILSYNAEDTIARAITSAQKQAWSNLEILVVDDASKDKSCDIIKSFAKEDARIKLIQHEKNKGAAAARNTVIYSSAGDFICFFDDDDESFPERVKTQYERIISYEKKTNAEFILCYASGTRQYSTGYEQPLVAIGSQGTAPHGKSLAARQLYYGGDKDFFYGGGTPTCSLMTRTSTLKKVNGFDINLKRSEDIDLAIRLSILGAHFIGCPEKLFIQHSTETPDKSYDRNLESEILLARKHKEYLKTVGMYRYAKKWPYLRYAHFTKNYLLFLKMILILIILHPIKTLSHILETGPQRLRHESKIRRGA